MRFVSIVGARPQFIKAAPLLDALAARHHASLLVHTGQHYDTAMSGRFFDELQLPVPDFNLGVGSGPHGKQTADMLERLEPVLVQSAADWVIVFGDTNSTLAGSLVASKLRIKLAHVEAGLRSFNRTMPEEVNRLVADQLADALFCPSDSAAANLAREGITRGVHVVGDLMAESLAAMNERAFAIPRTAEALGLSRKSFLLLTIHRAGTADDSETVDRILGALHAAGEPVVFPVHPRTRRVLPAAIVSKYPRIHVVEPVGYLEMLQLAAAARMVVTDSGGVQKEAYWLGTPCVTLRNETEWIETIDVGWNRLAGTDAERIAEAVAAFRPPVIRPPLYSQPDAAGRIASILTNAAVVAA